ncbi:NAD(P)-dependent oxidoreductase [Rathayibacter sp. CAU 1779]
MTTIALFGATGKTGSRVLARALAQGYDVRALVRDPHRLKTTSDRLTVIAGDVLDPVAVGRTVEGADAVVSVFGHVKGSPATLQTEGTKVIAEAMRERGVTRVVSLSGGGVAAPEDRPKLPDRMIKGALMLLSPAVLADAEGHLAVLQDSDLDWTVVRGPRLTERPGKGRYRVGWAGVNASTQVSRDDLADFILTQVDDRTFVGRLPFVSD